MAENLILNNENPVRDEQDIAIQISGLKKRYKLGLITAGTLKGDLQSWWARKRGKEDPNLKIGAKRHNKNEVFMALDGIDLTIYKGERVGIIGHNGAGKSTLLKLLARVTGPTEGEIKIDGRITSMLEVGTGFNGELTGRENIYLNGAILGMTKAEVDSKMEQIIEFSECRQFIDTPVKRYSSGMFVKLAFSVAAHLDSEIMIMDEVLAVGDMAFQTKCLEKMSDVSKTEGRTILYVSHNMNTIRQLCSRCIVLNHGKIIFNGDVEEAINIYLGREKKEYNNNIIVTDSMRDSLLAHPNMRIEKLLSFSKDNIYKTGEKLRVKITINNDKKEIRNVLIRAVIFTQKGILVGMCFNDKVLQISHGENDKNIEIDISKLAPEKYLIDLVLLEQGYNCASKIDVIKNIFYFEVEANDGFYNNMKWNPNWWGYTYGRIDEVESTNL